MVAPPEVTKFPAASLVVNLRVTGEPELTEAAETVMTEVAALEAPGTTVTVGEAVVIEDPPMVAVMLVAVPANVPVKVAV